MLNAEKCGVSIKDSRLNVSCYVDDVLLASTTTTGLQKLTDIAAEYVTKHVSALVPKSPFAPPLGRAMHQTLSGLSKAQDYPMKRG